MPVHPVAGGGWQWGNSGKVFPTKAQAMDQEQAAVANGFKENPKQKAAAAHAKNTPPMHKKPSHLTPKKHLPPQFYQQQKGGPNTADAKKQAIVNVMSKYQKK